MIFRLKNEKSSRGNDLTLVKERNDISVRSTESSCGG